MFKKEYTVKLSKTYNVFFHSQEEEAGDPSAGESS